MTQVKALQKQLDNLSIPYPQKLYLKVEIEEHLSHEAVSDANQSLTETEIAELSEIHNTWAFRILYRLGPKVHLFLYSVYWGAPLLVFLYYLKEEGFMFEFIREGGAAMYPILLLGLVLLARELRQFFAVVVVKDHKKANLDLETNALFVGGAALMALGLCGTALGIYFSANTVAVKELPFSYFLIGLKESMGSIIVATAATSLILLLNFTTRQFLKKWRAPITS